MAELAFFRFTGCLYYSILPLDREDVAQHKESAMLFPTKLPSSKWISILLSVSITLSSFVLPSPIPAGTTGIPDLNVDIQGASSGETWFTKLCYGFSKEVQDELKAEPHTELEILENVLSTFSWVYKLVVFRRRKPTLSRPRSPPDTRDTRKSQGRAPACRYGGSCRRLKDWHSSVYALKSYDAC
ncbi:hypothetical protein SeMB42_g06525 [Synchytrium endobioticum]|uniref:Uncharacterized protein n=1 Tax=Synchytrium endobioticum TaxID=286115 RepID=A0A507CHF4_9FUNG|nr:hypothetical protein SeMB42_g06525 [Synchytrium endobioticum]